MANSRNSTIEPLNLDLKPCPFCGSIDITVYAVDDTLSDNGTWKLYCGGCPAHMSVAYLLGNYSKGDKHKMLKELTKDWNKRKNEVHRKRSKSPSNCKEAGLTKGNI